MTMKTSNYLLKMATKVHPVKAVVFPVVIMDARVGL